MKSSDQWLLYISRVFLINFRFSKTYLSSGAKVALIVFDITRKDTFYGITSWIQQLNENAPSDICKHLLKYWPWTKYLLVIAMVGNKTDLVDQEQISLDEIAAFAKV